MMSQYIKRKDYLMCSMQFKLDFSKHHQKMHQMNETAIFIQMDFTLIFLEKKFI